MSRITIALSIVIVLVVSCTPEEERLSNKPVTLRFSTDTVIFDTVFTQIGSITKRVKVYNDDNFAVELSDLSVVGVSSPYNLVVKGEPTNSVQDLLIQGKDSIEILVSVNIDPGDVNLPFIVSDSIRLSNLGNEQFINLVAWGQDAYFLSDSILVCNTVWTNEKPYVLYNSVLIDTLCTLTIQPGTRIYSHPGSTFYVKGTLDAQGSPEERILFSNDRFDGPFREAPGQWEGIYFLEGSVDNRIQYVEIRNSVLGLRLGSPDDNAIPDVVVSETEIHNISQVGILAFTSDLVAENVLIYNCGVSCVANLAGGNYTYRHCSLINYPFSFIREDPIVSFSDFIVLPDESLLEDDIYIEFHNSVIWGPLADELSLNTAGNKTFTFNSSNSVIKSTIGEIEVNGNILNRDPDFLDIDISDYSPNIGSILIDNSGNSDVKIDLYGNNRDELPDIGAIEYRN